MTLGLTQEDRRHRKRTGLRTNWIGQMGKALGRIPEFAAQIVATPVPPADCEPGT